MSSLPPYNPAPSRRLVWLLNRDGHREALAACGPELQHAGAGWVDQEALCNELAGRLLDVRWRLLVVGKGDEGNPAALTSVVRASGGSAIVIAGEEVLHPLLCAMLQLPSERSRFRFLPGAVTTVQLLDDRAVIRHLNQGASV